MISSHDVLKMRVFVKNKKGQVKKYGKVRSLVLHPTRPKVVGILIQRPDLLLMKKRDDRFASFDRLTAHEAGYVADTAADSWDKAACKRLNVSFDECIIWDYMPVRTRSGKEIGIIKDVIFDEETLEVHHIDISANSADKAILGATRLSADLVVGYSDGAIVVNDEALAVQEAGGAAAKAGEAWAVAKHKTATAAAGAGKAATEATGRAVGKGAELVGQARKKIDDAVDEHEAKKEEEQKSGDLTGVDKAAKSFGKQLGRASHMFKDFKEEFDKASKE